MKISYGGKNKKKHIKNIPKKIVTVNEMIFRVTVLPRAKMVGASVKPAYTPKSAGNPGFKKHIERGFERNLNSKKKNN